jgi:hypothetical protein
MASAASAPASATVDNMQVQPLAIGATHQYNRAVSELDILKASCTHASMFGLN